MLNLAGRTETYLQQERQRRREAETDAGDIPGDVDLAESRREAFDDS